MKEIYIAPTIQAAEAALNDFATKWEHKYSYTIQSWKNNWEDLTVFFEFPVDIRKIIYTTNRIEHLNGKIRTAKRITNTIKKHKRMSKIHQE